MTALSVIIVNHNNAPLLNDCLDSIYRSTHSVNFEIILVDNASSDNSVEMVKTKFPRVRIIENQVNLGFSRANNQALKIYQGKYALLLNDDTIVRDGSFDRMVEFMDAHAEAGAGGPKLINPDGSPQHQGGMFARKFWLAKRPVKVDYVIGACLMVRREVIDKVGGLDENFYFSNEDLDWCRRIRKAGWAVYFLPQADVVHLGGYTIRKFDRKLFVEGFRGGLFFCRKHYGPIACLLYRFLLALTMLPAMAFTLLLFPVGNNRQKFGAYWQVLWIALMGQILSGNPGRGKRILLLSNGHAEDLAAAAIGAEVRRLAPEAELSALPLVGLGKAYDRNDIQNLGLRKILPSGGFAKEGFGALLADLRAGMIGQFLNHIKILRNESKRTDLIVGVGDAYLVALAGLFGRKPLIFVDGPKSVRIAGYWEIEKWLMRKFCKKVVVQDMETADFLVKQNIPALFLGSWVMDYVEVTGYDFGLPQSRTVIGILPGTREEAYANLGLILEVFDRMYLKDNNLIGLIASTLDRDRIRIKGWQRSGDKLVSASGASALTAEGKFGDVCRRSKLIIGLAGIANEQAVAFGKPVVCFAGSGPQTTLRRWQEIQKITGDSMAILTGNSDEKADRILEILWDPQRLEEMGRLGKASKPKWGGVKRISELAAEALNFLNNV